MTGYAGKGEISDRQKEGKAICLPLPAVSLGETIYYVYRDLLMIFSSALVVA